MSDNKRPVSVTLPPSLMLRMDALAEQDGSNRSAIVRKAVLRLLAENEPNPTPVLSMRRAA